MKIGPEPTDLRGGVGEEGRERRSLARRGAPLAEGLGGKLA